jgi:hypothetical protein
VGIALGRRRALFLVALLSILLVSINPSHAFATTTYPVPDEGLSFDANDSTPGSACAAGYGNLLSDAEADEVNFLKAGDTFRYQNVANIGGQRIDARVTLVSITGMQTRVFTSSTEAALDRLDKCDIDSKTRLVEVNFDSVSARPGDANFVLKFDFFEGATATAATLTNLKMNVEDIDSNQYLEVDNFTSTRLAPGRSATDLQEYSNTQSIEVGHTSPVTLSTTATARRFHALGSSSSSDPVAEKDKHVAEITYASTNSITLKLGVYESGGGSFDIDFRGFSFESDSQTQPSASDSSPNPATHLDLQARVGQAGASTPVLMEGEGLRPGSAYSLTLREPSRVIQSGNANTGGRFSHLVNLPSDLKPGSYTITLSAIGKNGESLVLTQSFRIAADGRFSQIGAAVPTVKGGLAQTGARSSVVLGGFAIAALATLAGMALSVTSRRRVQSL